MSGVYYSDDTVTLYHGDCREVMPTLDRTDCIVADPPYGETSLPWDRWPDGWPSVAAGTSSSLWTFGSLRMFLTHRDEFAAWKLSQDVIWHKPRGGVAARDRATVRVHEQVSHWYLGPWADVYHHQQRPLAVTADKGLIRRSPTGPAWTGSRRAHEWTDDGTRALPSVIKCQSMRLRGDHPTEKPTGILEPLITYACPTGGTVLDPFAGSGSTAVAAVSTGRRAVLIEANERYCEVAARRLSQGVLDFREPA